jgi:hypothetical protein
MERALMKSNRSIIFAISLAGIVLILGCNRSYGFVCSGSMYNNPDFQQTETKFSPYDKIFLIVDCNELEIGKNYTMHANWIHQKRGVIRSDKYSFLANGTEKRGIFFWLKLSKKGPMASMLSNQDFYEENFGDWQVETYIDGKLATENRFLILD